MHIHYTASVVMANSFFWLEYTFNASTVLISHHAPGIGYPTYLPQVTRNQRQLRSRHADDTARNTRKLTNGVRVGKISIKHCTLATPIKQSPSIRCMDGHTP